MKDYNYEQEMNRKQKRRFHNMTGKRLAIGVAVLVLVGLLTAGANALGICGDQLSTNVSGQDGFSLDHIPEYDGSPWVEIDGNQPAFEESQISTKPMETLGDLDELGRCTSTIAVIGKESMPTGTRGSISEVIPTGWINKQYDSVEGNWLYNRSHLIGWQLTGDDAIPRNLITGTRYMNVEGMEPFENRVADYIRSSGNHVVYRSTPIFEGDELVCRGVHLEAMSVEDDGRGISFNVFCYNVQPGIVIDYATGKSHSTIDGDEITDGKESSRQQFEKDDDTGSRDAESTRSPSVSNGSAEASEAQTYVLNTNTDKFHYPDCRSVQSMADHNKKTVKTTRDQLIEEGYDPCGNCHP